MNEVSESEIRNTVERILTQFAGAIEFWTVNCISRSNLGDPVHTINEQWEQIGSQIQYLRSLVNQDLAISEIVHDQIAKLTNDWSTLRQIFEVLIDGIRVPLSELEQAVIKLRLLWEDVQMRLALIAAFIPLTPPLPALTSAQENYYKNILDRLYDQFLALRSYSESI